MEMFLIIILKIPDSNFGPDQDMDYSGFHVFPQYLQANIKILY